MNNSASEIDLLKRIAEGLERSNRILLTLLSPGQRQAFQRQEALELARKIEPIQRSR